MVQTSIVLVTGGIVAMTITYIVGYPLIMNLIRSFRTHNAVLGIEHLPNGKVKRYNVVRLGFYDWSWKRDGERSDEIKFKYYVQGSLYKKHEKSIKRNDVYEMETLDGKPVFEFGLQYRDIQWSTIVKFKDNILKSALAELALVKQRQGYLENNFEDEIRNRTEASRRMLVFPPTKNSSTKK